MRTLILIAMLCFQLPEREYLLLTTEQFTELNAYEKQYSVRWSNDSTAVLLDNHGNIPFDAEEKTTFESLGEVLFIKASEIVEWLNENNWNNGGEE